MCSLKRWKLKPTKGTLWSAFQRSKNSPFYLTAACTGTLRRIKGSTCQPISESGVDLTQQFINQTWLSGQDWGFGIHRSHRCSATRINIIVVIIKRIFHGIVSVDAGIGTGRIAFFSSPIVNWLSSEGTSHAPFFRLFFSIKITAAKGENAVNGLIFKKDRTQVFFQKRQLYLPVPMSNKSKRQFWWVTRFMNKVELMVITFRLHW